MYFLTISTLDDLEVIKNEPLYFDKNILGNKDLAYENMWCITLAEDACQKITSKNILLFLSDLLHKRSQQINLHYPLIEATFYAWFDSQALQLRFDLLPGSGMDLPFKCVTRLVALDSIVHSFIATTRTVMHNEGILKIISTENDASTNDCDYAEDCFVLDVYVEILNQQK